MGRRGTILRAALVAALVCSRTLPVTGSEILATNGDFETGDATGWTEWKSPWGGPFSYDYAWADSPYEGGSSLHQYAPSGSFGVYQELCVEPGIPVQIAWAWKGATLGDGWWEVLIVDAAYSYEAVDDPANHPETFLASKWETGFGGPYPAPSSDWVTESAEMTPTSDIVTLVLKCGSVSGGQVDAWFDAVAFSQATTVLEVTGIVPALGKTAGGDAVSVRGRVFPDGTTAKLGGADLVDPLRWGTCEVRGKTPPGAAGFVDVTVTARGSSVTLPAAFRYVPPPTVASITPNSGKIAGGTAVTIAGEFFVGFKPSDVVVEFGTRRLQAAAVTSETTITGKSPPGTAGPVDVKVKTPFGETTVPGGFTYTDAAVGPFLRGDLNADGAADLSDAVRILNWLFLGEAAPGCIAAANSNGDGGIDICDPLNLLFFAFAGGPAPLAPYPACGQSTSATDVALGCATPPANCQ